MPSLSLSDSLFAGQHLLLLAVLDRLRFILVNLRGHLGLLCLPRTTRTAVHKAKRGHVFRAITACQQRHVVATFSQSNRVKRTLNARAVDKNSRDSTPYTLAEAGNQRWRSVPESAGPENAQFDAESIRAVCVGRCDGRCARRKRLQRATGNVHRPRSYEIFHRRQTDRGGGPLDWSDWVSHGSPS